MIIHVRRVKYVVRSFSITIDRVAQLAMDKRRDIYLVVGGNGFLGRHIVQQLRDRGDIVSSFDILERYNDIPFYPGDISDQSSVASALRQVCCSFSSFYSLQFSLAERNYMYNTYCVTARDGQQPRTIL